MKPLDRLIGTLGVMVLTSASALASGSGSVNGTYVEARTAEVMAGACVMNGETGTMGSQAVLAWKVDRGSFDGVALDGLSVVAAVAGSCNLGLQELGGEQATTRAVVFADRRANAAQQKALVAMVRHLSNGVVGVVLDIAPAAIRFDEDSHAIRVAAGPATLEVIKHGDHDASCGDTQWFRPLSSVDGATIGVAERHAFMGMSLGTRWSHPNKRSAFFGTFGK